jgi:hypothetical protein
MSHRPSHQGPTASRRCFPEVKALESRLLLSRSQTVSFPDGSSLVFPLLRNLPRTGGVSVQRGSVMGIGVGQPTTNSVQVTDEGAGDDTDEWNGGPVHSLTGITSTVIQLQRARTNQITIQLTSQRTGPAAVAVGAIAPTDRAVASAREHPFNLKTLRTSGSAFQTGSVLTVTVDRPMTNTVEISNEGGGAVATKWNGGAVHSFTGVDTIVVNTQNARKDLVAIDDATG